VHASLDTLPVQEPHRTGGVALPRLNGFKAVSIVTLATVGVGCSEDKPGHFLGLLRGFIISTATALDTLGPKLKTLRMMNQK
jgi:hypothetical protein